MIAERKDPVGALTFALEKYPQQVEAVPLRRVLLDSARENAKRPAYVKLAVPDDIVKSVRGSAEDGDLVLLVRVPKEVLQRQGSRIVLPGEVG